MISIESNRILDIRFNPLIKLAGELLTETQNTAFEVGYCQGIDDLVTYLHKKGIAMPLEINGLRGSAVSQIIEKEV